MRIFLIDYEKTILKVIYNENNFHTLIILF